MRVKAAEREGRRSTLSVRLTPEGRARLDQAASASGRSLAQEVEMRLEKSFGDDVFYDQLFGSSRHSRNFIEAAATAIRRIETVRESRWVSDYGTLWACRRAVNSVVGLVFGFFDTEPKCGEDEKENKEFVKYLAVVADDAYIEACRDLGLVAAGPARGEVMRLVNTTPSDAVKKSSGE